ncbi:MAG: hypothetical protein EB156_04130 [Euryarchaeota archaeon]|nr:hypothetical protein [Euryarchaeota archaeon]NDB93974.1 hypothetical protein [Euryarchaeota archaeon]NDF36959.1 hypothetical protein [Euryarchaeota archaeon]NDG21811.1 hypothetical protein [Euryarchaeota archaeon]
MKNQTDSHADMLSDLLMALSKPSINVDELRGINQKLPEWLVNEKDTGNLSNESYLVAGKIEGGIDVILAMIDHKAPENEIRIHIESMKTRIENILL